jgi:ABC-2 type transport system permease protein
VRHLLLPLAHHFFPLTPKKYSNARAMRALIKASLQAIVKSPSAVVFSLAFPLIFILVFGFLGGERGYSVRIAKVPGSDSVNSIYKTLQNVPVISWALVSDTVEMNRALREGNIAATINIQKLPEGVSPQYIINIDAASSQMDKVMQLRTILNEVIQRQDPQIQERTEALANITVRESFVREYKTIDFILPGQLGFSLLASGVFGTAFVFFNMRQTLVLKRFFATPVRRDVIIVSEGIARMIFQIAGSFIIIMIGHYAFGFTLVNGWITFVEMLVLCAIGLLVFMGFGFIVSGLAKSEATIPPLSNIITLPQFLLAGTFFSIEAFPSWLQVFCKILPLTYLNDALRKVAFDGASLWEVRMDALVLLTWGVVVYVIAGRVFKWE